MRFSVFCDRKNNDFSRIVSLRLLPFPNKRTIS